MAKPPTDWEAIEAGYRFGVSNTNLSMQFNVSENTIRKRASRHKWERNNALSVAERARLVLARREAEKAADTPSPQEIFDQAVTETASILDNHKVAACKGRQLAELAMHELLETFQNRDSIEDAILEETENDTNGMRRGRMLAAVSLAGNAKVLRDIATSLKSFVDMEREAHGLNEQSSGSEGLTLEQLIDEAKDITDAQPVEVPEP